LLSTGTLDSPQLPSHGLAPRRPVFPPSPLNPHACTSLGTPTSTPAPTDHEGPSTSSDDVVGTTSPAVTCSIRSTPPGVAPQLGRVTRKPTCHRPASRMARSLTPPVARRSSAITGFGPSHQSPANRGAPTPRLPNPERLPPMSPVPPTHACTCAGVAGPPLVPRFSRLGPASFTRSPAFAS